ncbi:Rrf2 family transcriptional regulator [Gemmobacter sp. 24YEA27]|uniref:RrF2 family transcriptional regulator n=1 Tax=Gemmobacter sp. 24YEA27 TaxID=3040672 RepID=UPI0024B34D3D|nr:Rrf2 family transcriptional regulator [Gemmobacter sp. 24YEA27]
MHISARTDYALRAMIELAAHGEEPLKCETIARAQAMPLNFLVNILNELKRAGLVHSQRGTEGGYWLARPARTISVGEIIRAIEGEIALVRGTPPQSVDYNERSRPLQDVWIAFRAAIREVLDETSLANLADGNLPDVVRRLSDGPHRWQS